MGIHKAINKLVQSSAAYQMKQAMINADAAGLMPPLQIHDELCDTTDDGDPDGTLLKEIMENSIKLSVPNKVDLEIGPSWGEAK